jgi:SAM-dependent methyltransferase
MFSSFRDPDGCLVASDDRILRFVARSGEENLSGFLRSAVGQRFVASGNLVDSKRLESAGADGIPSWLRLTVTGGEIVSVYEHERIGFQNYPYEWPAEMLYAAAQLTLDLGEQAIAEGFGLKDATPYNILFRYAQPVFVDLLSFEKRVPTDPIWLPYAQFLRTFLLPLLAHEHLGVRLDQLYLNRREGVEPEDVYRLCGAFQKLKLRPPFLSLVSIPTWLSRSPRGEDRSIYEARQARTPEQAQFILRGLFRRLRRQLLRTRPRRSHSSTWTEYMISAENFPLNYLADKELFVREALAEFKPARLLDVGSNTGHFSRLAESCGCRVVAIDQDPAVAGDLWREAQTRSLKILPLVIDLTRPSPAVGWRNREQRSFLDRARHAFDAVMMLAVAHHMLVTERIPLGELLNLAAELTNDLLIIEFVAPDDPMFLRLTRGRDHLFAGLTNEGFRAACLERFHLIRSRQLGRARRWIYLLRKK